MINAVLLVFSLIISLPICHLLRLSTLLRMSMQNNEQDRLDKLNLEIELADGESILTEISRKFDIETMKKQLASHGLAPLKVWTDPRRWFGLILCQA